MTYAAKQLLHFQRVITDITVAYPLIKNLKVLKWQLPKL